MFWNIVILFFVFCGLWAMAWAALDNFRLETEEMARKAESARAMARLDW